MITFETIYAAALLTSLADCFFMHREEETETEES